MQVDLDVDEIAMLIESLDCLKIKISYLKGAAYAEKTAKLVKAEAIELKLSSAVKEPDA